MTPSRSRRPRAVRNCGDEAGATVVELIMAAGLTLVAAGLIVPTLIVPLGRVTDRLGTDPGRARLEAAAETFARAVRAARPGADGPAAAVTPTTLTLTMVTTDGPATTTLDLSADGLRIVPTGPGAAAVDLPATVPIAGLDLGASRFIGVFDLGAVAAGEELEAVTLVLSGVSGRIERTARLRVVHPLRGAIGR